LNYLRKLNEKEIEEEDKIFGQHIAQKLKINDPLKKEMIKLKIQKLFISEVYDVNIN